MLIPSIFWFSLGLPTSLSRGMNANSQPLLNRRQIESKSIKRDEC